jgi:DNA-binding PadR family transcriptional regulator
MTPLYPGGEDKAAQGANPQAHAWLRRMVKQGLIKKLMDGSYEITEAGKILAQQFREKGEE